MFVGADNSIWVILPFVLHFLMIIWILVCFINEDFPSLHIPNEADVLDELVDDYSQSNEEESRYDNRKEVATQVQGQTDEEKKEEGDTLFLGEDTLLVC